MAEMTRAEVAARLVEVGTRADIAALYADAFVEFREAIANIERNGSVVANPRTGAPIDNPYLRVRDRAFDRLRKMRGVSSGCLWENATGAKKQDGRKKQG